MSTTNISSTPPLKSQTSRISKHAGNFLISQTPNQSPTLSNTKSGDKPKTKNQDDQQNSEDSSNEEETSLEEEEDQTNSDDTSEQPNPFTNNFKNHTSAKPHSSKKLTKKDYKLFPNEPKTYSLKHRKPVNNEKVPMTVYVEPPILYFDQKQKDDTEIEDSDFDKNKELSYNELLKIYRQLRVDYQNKVKQFKSTLQKADEYNYDIKVLKAQVEDLQAQQAIVDKEFVSLGLSNQT